MKRATPIITFLLVLLVSFLTFTAVSQADSIQNLHLVDTLAFSGVEHIATTSNYAFMANDTAVVRFASDSQGNYSFSAPVIVSGTINDIFVTDEVLVVVTAFSDTQTVYLYDVTTLQLISNCKIRSPRAGDYPAAVAAVGDYVYISALPPSSPAIVDIQTRETPVAAAEFQADMDDVIVDMDIANGYLYTIYPDTLMRIYSLADPLAPVFVADYLYLSTPTAIVVEEDLAFVAYDGEIKLSDISNPSQISDVGTHQTASEVLSMDAQDTLLYVLYGNGGMEILDITNPSSPVLAGAFGLFGVGKSIIASGDYILSASETAVEVYTMGYVEGTPEWHGAVQIPMRYVLTNVYPNPFNPSFTATIELETEAAVQLRLFDMLGREIATIADGTFSPGVHNISSGKLDLPSGSYVLRMSAPGQQEHVRHVIMVK